MAEEEKTEETKKFPYVSPRRLKFFKEQLDSSLPEKYVEKETVADHPERDKVLSDNNLTDELLEKINNAGSGSYDSLTDKPKINDVEVSGEKTAAEYHLVKDDDYATAEKAGIVKASDKFSVGEDGTVTIDFSGLSTDESVDSKIEQAKKEIEEEIDAKISSVYTPAGDITFETLPEPSEEELGNVYNVTNAFVTNDKFVNGAGKAYPPDTDVAIVKRNDEYKYNALSGFVDLTGYTKEDDFEEITTEEIQSWFAEA